MSIDELIEIKAREIALDVIKKSIKNGGVTTLPRMRTVDKAVAEIRQSDPNTEVTSGLIKELVAQGKLSYQSVGNKKLINLDELVQYLANSSVAIAETDEIRFGIVRPIKE